MEEKVLTISEFYGGIRRDEKDKTRGAASNIEEVDIFTNAHFIQAEQIMSSDSMPADTEVTAYTADNSDNVWGYGKNTADSNKVRLVKVTTGGADNPGAFSTAFTSSDGTDVHYAVSPIQYLRQDNGNKNFLYYTTNASGTVKLKRYDITANSESETDSSASNMTLSGANGSYDRISMRVLFGELLITHGQYIAKIDKDGVFTEKAFTLPNGWEAVDIIPVSDVGLILARNVNRLSNSSKGFWWDLTETVQVDDSFDIPFGGPQWIENHKETIKFLCAQNGEARFYQLSGAFPGAVPVEIPGMRLSNIATETTTGPISHPKMVDQFNNILVFGLNKTDKTAIYAIGQQDSDKPTALILTKRFATTDYSNHTSYAVMTQGPNFYAAFDDNGTASNSRCETQNSPSRSSNAVYESIILDDNDPTTNKDLKGAYVTTKPLGSSVDIDLSIAPDYGSYTEKFRSDGTSLNTANAVLGYFRANEASKKVYKVKLAFTSNTTTSPIVTGIGLVMNVAKKPAFK